MYIAKKEVSSFVWGIKKITLDISCTLYFQCTLTRFSATYMHRGIVWQAISFCVHYLYTLPKGKLHTQLQARRA